MEQVAIDQGVGEHYIYDANQLHSRDRGISETSRWRRTTTTAAP